MISIIIPTLNEEKILEKMLQGIRILKDFEYEIIVSDGGSTDKTISIAQHYADKILIHKGGYRQTIGQGKNEAALKARGEYLVFLDADVFIPDINVFFSKAIAIFDNEKKLQGLTVFLKVLPEKITFFDILIWGLVNYLYVIQNNILHNGAASGEFQMIRAEAFKKIGGYDTSLVVGEDNKMFNELTKIGTTKISTKLFVLHTSRRAHVIGWGALIWAWISNFLYVKITKKSFDKEWKVIR